MGTGGGEREGVQLFSGPRKEKLWGAAIEKMRKTNEENQMQRAKERGPPSQACRSWQENDGLCGCSGKDTVRSYHRLKEKEGLTLGNSKERIAPHHTSVQEAGAELVLRKK